MATQSPPWKPTPLGHEMRQHFSFAPGYRNLNHGSFGTSPIAIRNKANELRDECEATPCPFIKYRWIELLNDSRAAVSRFLAVDTSTVVLVPNATTAVNSVLRNIEWNNDGKDEILQLDVVYGACGKTTNYICEFNEGKVRTREIRMKHPMEHPDFVSAFKATITASRAEGFRPRIAIFDTISSNPGMRLPFEELTMLCRSEGVLSLIDGAHGIGQIELNLASLDPDFFVSNCHKWLMTPRGCAVFYVPIRNQALMRSTLPTSHGFIPRSSQESASKSDDEKPDFVNQWDFTGTSDNIAFLTVAEAIRWRREVCGGEGKIRDYCTALARRGGKRVADILGTEVLDNKSHLLSACFMVNILLPISKPTSNLYITEWMQQRMVKQHRTFMPVFPFQGFWWVRLSGQIYLEDSDFEWAGWTLKALCEELANVDE